MKNSNKIIKLNDKELLSQEFLNTCESNTNNNSNEKFLDSNKIQISNNYSFSSDKILSINRNAKLNSLDLLDDFDFHKHHNDSKFTNYITRTLYSKTYLNSYLAWILICIFSVLLSFYIFFKKRGK
jgi:hypothetical protein